MRINSLSDQLVRAIRSALLDQEWSFTAQAATTAHVQIADALSTHATVRYGSILATRTLRRLAPGHRRRRPTATGHSEVSVQRLLSQESLWFFENQPTSPEGKRLGLVQEVLAPFSR